MSEIPWREEQRLLQRDRSATPVGGYSSELCIGTRKSSEEERQAVLRESPMGNGEDRGKTSIEVRGGAEGFPLGHAPGHGIEQQRGLTEMLLRSKCGAKRGVILRPECRDTRSSEAAQPRIGQPGRCNCQHCKDHRKGDACEGGLGCVTARARPNQVPNTAKININADQPTEVRPEEVFPWTQLPQQRQ